MPGTDLNSLSHVIVSNVYDSDNTSLRVTVVSGASVGGTSSTVGAAFPSTATAVGFNDGTNMQGARVFDLDSGAGSQYVMGVSLRAAGSGGSTALLGQAAMAASLPVVIASDQSALSFSIGSNATVDLNKVAGNSISAGNGTAGTGCQRVTIASDNTAFSVNATLSAETTKVIGTVNLSAAQTLATLTTITNDVNVNVKTINGVTTLMGNGVTGTGSQRVTIASDNTAFSVNATLSAETTKVIGTVNLSAAQTLATVTTVSTLTGGAVAHDGADSGNPIKTGGRAVNAEIAAVANNDRSDFITDLTGKQIVLPYANPENFVSGCISSAMTGTTSTSLVAAPASGLRNYITQITVSNSHATVGTDIIIQDGSGGTTLYVIPAAAVFGGATLTFPTPLRQPTTATALFCANVTTGANTKVSASGYKGA